jgi:hypothetical protein
MDLEGYCCPSTVCRCLRDPLRRLTTSWGFAFPVVAAAAAEVVGEEVGAAAAAVGEIKPESIFYSVCCR